MYHAAKPTPEQLVWQDMELGVIIHFCVDIYNPDFKRIKNAGVRDAIPPERITPKDLDVDQWLRSVLRAFVPSAQKLCFLFVQTAAESSEMSL